MFTYLLNSLLISSSHLRSASCLLLLMSCQMASPYETVYDQTLQWPPDVRFSLTLYMNETNWKTEEVNFPSDKSSDHSFMNSTRNFFMIKDGLCVEYEIKKGYDITATVFYLDIIENLVGGNSLFKL